MDGDGDGGYGGYGRDQNDYSSSNRDYNDYNTSSNQDSYSGFIDTSSDDKYKEDDVVEYTKKRVEDPDFEVLDEEETHPDGAIPRIVLAGLSGSGEKPQQNGDAPASEAFLKESSLGNFAASQQDINNGCNSGDCMYYTLMCCECSIL